MADAGGGLDVAALGLVDLDAVARRVARYERAIAAVRARLWGALDPRVIDALDRHLCELPARPVVAFAAAIAEADLDRLRRVRDLLGADPPAAWGPAALLTEALVRREQAFGGAVIVPASLAGAVRALLAEGLTARAHRDGGLPRSDGVVALLDQLGRAASREHPGTDIGTSGQPTVQRGVSVTEMAGRMGCTESYVRRLARRGVIPARRSGGVWILEEPDADDPRTTHPYP
ncbi:hypothetical protein FF36_01883 [Frankia torreyi]|uniref:Helix-turn-helix domain-containing protein n=1 Tax=Frankia torreyi TaxID=1856 RepID=A0A0D8BHE1_9ACTN|nr:MULTISPECIES: DNA-binding protein [Frankia]KJE23698.1 hypothetical protein FF36_01883 [Frankia torreyi]